MASKKKGACGAGTGVKGVTCGKPIAYRIRGYFVNGADWYLCEEHGASWNKRLFQTQPAEKIRKTGTKG